MRTHALVRGSFATAFWASCSMPIGPPRVDASWFLSFRTWSGGGLVIACSPYESALSPKGIAFSSKFQRYQCGFDGIQSCMSYPFYRSTMVEFLHPLTDEIQSVIAWPLIYKKSSALYKNSSCSFRFSFFIEISSYQIVKMILIFWKEKIIFITFRRSFELINFRIKKNINFQFSK